MCPRVAESDSRVIEAVRFAPLLTAGEPSATFLENRSTKGGALPTARFGVSIEDGLLRKFDRLLAGKGYQSRSEAIRDLIRDVLVSEEWEEGTMETAGTITLVYSHDTRELTERLTDLQHRHHAAIMSTMHLHLDGHTCLEVLVVKGKGSEIRKVADRLIGTKGVIHGKLSLATTGKEIG